MSEPKEDLIEGIGPHESVAINTVGIDVGSATSHVMFARVVLVRRSRTLSPRLEVASREVLFRSVISFTPYIFVNGESLIDTRNLDQFIRGAFEQAGFQPSDIDSGAVILTGEAVKRRNSNAIAELFSRRSGNFVVASAGHHLESAMAANGSGAASVSRRIAGVVLNVDVGGGTTKLAVIDRGVVVATAAVRVGSRALVRDDAGAVLALEEPALRAMEWCGLGTDPSSISGDVAERIARALVDELVLRLTPVERQQDLRADAGWFDLTPALPTIPKFDAITFSGGVAEFLYMRTSHDDPVAATDLGAPLARAFDERIQLGDFGAPLVDPGEGIRATVVGASQHTVEMAGNTVTISDDELLPLRNLPVVRLHTDLSGNFTAEDVARAVQREGSATRTPENVSGGSAISFRWAGIPSYARIRRLAEGLCLAALERPERVGHPLVLLMDGDIARTLGELIRAEFRPEHGVIALDGLECREWDYVDIGRPIGVARLVPVVIKSLIFARP